MLGPPDGPPRRAPPKERENIASQSAHLGHTETWQPHQTPQKHHTTQSQGASPKPNPSIFSCARRKALLEEPGPQIAPPLRVEHLGVQSWWPQFHYGKAVRIFRAVAGRQADPAQEKPAIRKSSAGPKTSTAQAARCAAQGGPKGRQVWHPLCPPGPTPPVPLSTSNDNNPSPKSSPTTVATLGVPRAPKQNGEAGRASRTKTSLERSGQRARGTR